MKAFKPVSRGITLSEQVAHQIVDIISSGQIKSGQKLPSENQLCKSLHVSRPTLREALKSLAYVGMVRMQAGEGCFVAEGPHKFLDRVFHHSLLNTERDVSELTDARVLVEMELTSLCAQRRTEEDLRRLEFLISEMQRSVEKGGEGFLVLDMDYHFAIAHGSQHRVLGQLLGTIRGLLMDYISKGLQVPGSAAGALEQHQKIFEAIEQRNSRQARALMRSHLETFRRAYTLLMKASTSQVAVAEVTGESRSGEGG